VKITVVGAGVVGLSCAYELADLGHWAAVVVKVGVDELDFPDCSKNPELPEGPGRGHSVFDCGTDEILASGFRQGCRQDFPFNVLRDDGDSVDVAEDQVAGGDGDAAYLDRDAIVDD
jgi:thioredoxin reductase